MRYRTTFLCQHIRQLATTDDSHPRWPSAVAGATPFARMCRFFYGPDPLYVTVP